MPEYLSALDSEMKERAVYLEGESLETIYFGGGTPSLISGSRTSKDICEIYENFRLAPDCEITIEANPDDLSSYYLQELHQFNPGKPVKCGNTIFQ